MDVVRISSRKNALIKEVSALLGSAEKRSSTGTFLVEGARLTQDAARSGAEILKLFYTADARKKYDKYIEEAAEAAEEIYEVDDHVAPLLSSTKSSQGVYALCRCGANVNAGSISGRVIVLENIQDPSNMGNVLRTAEALGIKSVLLCGECCDVTSPKVLRASMGAVFRMYFIKASGPKEARSVLKAGGFEVYGAVPSSDAERISQVVFDEKKTVAIGNEGNGLTEEFKAVCDKLITIPMTGRAESLNAATAAAIIMWEMTK